ncbi:hypothetical protein HK101_001565 [Irineochytrium annulatum]|nr:hypothetical protein HK101_001565 [Irineochytrium annulatum]
MDASQPGPRFIASLGEKLRSSTNPPTSIVMVSAHYETKGGVTVSTNEKWGMYYDYYGFPNELYEIKYPARGHPALAQRALSLLSTAGISATPEHKRGLDHGSFTPLLYMYPEADIPVVVVSLPVTTDPREYYALGKALQPLRDEGCAIIGGGMMTHNLGEMRGRFGTPEQDKVEPWAKNFVDDVERAVLSNTGEARLDALVRAVKSPNYSKNHPTPEHFAPVLFAAGAAGEDEARLIHQSWSIGIFSEDSFVFGLGA